MQKITNIRKHIENFNYCKTGNGTLHRNSKIKILKITPWKSLFAITISHFPKVCPKLNNPIPRENERTAHSTPLFKVEQIR